MDFSQVINSMWGAYDFKGSGQIGKKDAMELIGGVCRNIPVLNENFDDFYKNLRTQNGLQPKTYTGKTSHFDKNLFDSFY
mgnify:CR=1 FL=1